MQRFFDIVFSGIALVLLSPLLLPLMFILRVTGEGECFFLPSRGGRGGKHFKLYKFATMLKRSPNMGASTITVCLISGLLGHNRDIFFSKLSEQLDLVRFSDIAVRYLTALGYKTVACRGEDEARERAAVLILQRRWPVCFFASDTTGEKDFEKWYTAIETLDTSHFENLGVIKNEAIFDLGKLGWFLVELAQIRQQMSWGSQLIVDLFNEMITDFNYIETGKCLDSRI